MSQRPVAPSPVALSLLEVAEREADGCIELAGRELWVRRGVATQLSPSPADPALEDYLAFAGRLAEPAAESARKERAHGRDPWPLLERHLSARLLRHATVRLWVERLARGVEEEENRSLSPPYFRAAAPSPESYVSAPLFELVLDAFAKRAAVGDADTVGEHAHARFVWDPSRDTTRAQAWLGVPALPEPPVVARILMAAPLAAPKLAALLRAGLAYLELPQSHLPPPPPRPPSMPPGMGASDALVRLSIAENASNASPDATSAAQGPTAAASASHGPPAPAAGGGDAAKQSTLPPPSPAALSFSPGRGQVTRVSASLPPPGSDSSPLDDPMEAMERLIAALEQSRAPGPERAKAWREAARIYDTHFGSLSEAARAFREAAAADPEDRVAQREAALRCAALGQFRIARAYAEAGAALARTEKERAAALKRVAQLAVWERDRERAVTALESARDADPSDTSLHQRLWSLLVTEGDREGATAAARAAAERLHAVEPAQARAMLAWAHHANPGDVELATEHAIACAYDGFGEAAVAALARSMAPLRAPGEGAQELLARSKTAIGHVSAPPGTPTRRKGAPALAVRIEAAGLAEQAFDAELSGNLDRAITFAWEAMRLDGDQPIAVTLLLDHLDRTSPSEQRRVVEAARRVLGDSVPLLRRASALARAAGDHREVDALLEDSFALAPQDAAAAGERLLFRAAHGSPEALRTALRDALNVDRFDDADACLTALGALEAKGDDASDLGLRALERLGHRSPDLLNWAVERAQRSGKPQFVIAVLEHAFARAPESEKVHVLRRIAAQFAEQGDPAREARTLLRVLAVAPYHQGTLERLSEIYTAAGEAERLMAVLSLRLESSTHPDARAQRLRDLAAAALHIAGDRERALGYVHAILDEAGDDPIRASFGVRALMALHKPGDVVQQLTAHARRRDPRAAATLWSHAVTIAETECGDPELALGTAVKGLAQSPQSAPLLLAFERLALTLAQVDTARGVYRSLMDRALGVHGRRALAYREARWLERAGDHRAALDAYAQTFALEPSAGVVLAAIERLARAQEEYEPLLAAWVHLAEHASNEDQRASLYERAAALTERELGSARRAFDLYLSAWRETGNVVHKEHARRLAQRVAAESPGDGAAAYSGLVAVLRERLEAAWTTEAKLGILREIASLYAFDCGAPDLAVATVDEAVSLAEKDPEASGARPDILVDAAEWLYARFERRDEAALRVRRALALAPTHPRALALAEEMRIGSISGGLTGRRPSFIPRVEAGPPDQALGALRDRVAAGDLDAGEELARTLVDRGQAREGHRMLLSIVRREPDRVRTLRELHALSAAIPVPATEAVTGEMLAMMDPGRSFKPARVVFQEGGVSTPYDRYLAPRSKLLRIVWEYASRIYRMERDQVGLVGTDRVAHLGKSPLSVAYADALRVIGVESEVELFTRRSENHSIFLCATRPPVAVIDVRPGRDDLEDLDALRFRIGRALELARPEHILLAPAAVTELESTRQRLLGAVVAAFAPENAAPHAGHEAAPVEPDADGSSRLFGALGARVTDGRAPSPARDAAPRPHVDPAVAALSAELWRQLPASAQGEATALIARLDDDLDFDAIELAARCRAACAGLAVSGRVAPSVRGLVADDPTLAGMTVTSEADYVSACRSSKPLRALIRFALSDEYLAAHALTASLTPG